MSKLRPGGFTITDQAMKLCAFDKGAKILDIGCGHGDTVNHLQETYGYQACGIDLSLPMIQEGKKKYPDLDLQYGDGEFLDMFSSFSFDGVLMECVLSLINLPDEALHEAFCVLQKGGKLILSDLYIKKPEEGLLRALEIEAERQRVKPHKEGQCSEEDHKERVVDFRFEGRFLQEPLLRQLEEIGFRILTFEDRSLDLDNFVAQKLMDDGNLEGVFCQQALLDAKERKRTGYFMLIAEKPLK